MVIYARGVAREVVERALILEVLKGGVHRFG